MVRNSWGTNWNNGGFFNIACTNLDLGINTEVKFDNNIDGLGGPIDFDAGIAGVPVAQYNKTVRPSKSTNSSLSSSLP